MTIEIEAPIKRVQGTGRAREPQTLGVVVAVEVPDRRRGIRRCTNVGRDCEPTWGADEPPMTWEVDEPPMTWEVDEPPMTWEVDEPPMTWEVDEPPMTWEVDEPPMTWDRDCTDY